MPHPRILYLEPLPGVSSGFRHALSNILEKQKTNLNLSEFFFINLNRLVTGTYIEKKLPNGKIKMVPAINDAVSDKVKKVLDDAIARIRPTQIVCNCGAALRVISGGDQISLANNRGSVYRYSNLDCIIFDDLARIKDTPHGTFILGNDCKKLSRIVHNRTKPQPAFMYTVCRTVSDCERAYEYLSKSEIISFDTETKGTTITSIQFAGLQRQRSISGAHEFRIHCFVIPFYNEGRPNNIHWDSEESEISVWRIVKRILALEVIKAGHNAAAYDSALLVKYRIPATNFLIDTLHMWHCLYAELPKSLDFVTSICVDYMRFWKEDHKGEQDEKADRDEAKLLGEGMENFWRYGALDVYYTLLDAIYLIPIISNVEYARVNYLREFPRQIGPCLAMSCRGIKVDFNYLQKLRNDWEKKEKAASQKLAIMVDNPEFNAGSWQQVQSLMFDVLGAKPERVKGKTGGTNEISLKMIGDQHPVYKKFADAILDVREARKIKSTYLYTKIRKKRFHYGLNAAGTYTERLSSGPFLWEGQNAQNIPDSLRGFLIADPGYFIFDIDLEQSDARFVAYESQDTKFIYNVECGKDTHCLHAAHFFKQSYDTIYNAVKAGIEKYAHKVTGIRAITKRIVHGANYQMAAYTLYTTMGREAVVAAAKAIGIHNAATYDVRQLVKVCETFLEEYHVLYPRLRQWHKEIKTALVKTRTLTTAYGWTNVFFGDPENGEVQRSATAFYGQGGTGGCINNALDLSYWGDPNNNCERIDGGELRLLLQVHDSIVGLSEISDRGARAVARLMEYMQWNIQIKGREMRVPASASIGVRWGRYTEKVKYEQLLNGEWRDILQKCIANENEIVLQYVA